MIVKTPAIVLRRYPYTETSMVVTWLTPDAGRLNTLIKGAFRPKSPFLGQVDLFYTCELLYYGRNSDGLLVTREVTPIKVRSRLRQNWRACAIASYLSSLVSRATPPNATLGAVYAWLENALDDLSGNGVTPEMLFREELQFLYLLGLAPRAHQCLGCDVQIPAEGEVHFSAREGGWWCASCSSRARREACMPVPSRAVQTLADWQRSDASTSSPGVLIMDVIERMLGAFIQHHLDVAPAPRAAALDIIARKPARPVDRVPSVR